MRQLKIILPILFRIIKRYVKLYFVIVGIAILALTGFFSKPQASLTNPFTWYITICIFNFFIGLSTVMTSQNYFGGRRHTNPSKLYIYPSSHWRITMFFFIAGLGVSSITSSILELFASLFVGLHFPHITFLLLGFSITAFAMSWIGIGYLILIINALGITVILIACFAFGEYNGNDWLGCSLIGNILLISYPFLSYIFTGIGIAKLRHGPKIKTGLGIKRFWYSLNLKYKTIPIYPRFNALNPQKILLIYQWKHNFTPSMYYIFPLIAYFWFFDAITKVSSVIFLTYFFLLTIFLFASGAGREKVVKNNKYIFYLPIASWDYSVAYIKTKYLNKGILSLILLIILLNGASKDFFHDLFYSANQNVIFLLFWVYWCFDNTLSLFEYIRISRKFENRFYPPVKIYLLMFVGIFYIVKYHFMEYPFTFILMGILWIYWVFNLIPAIYAFFDAKKLGFFEKSSLKKIGLGYLCLVLGWFYLFYTTHSEFSLIYVLPIHLTGITLLISFFGTMPTSKEIYRKNILEMVYHRDPDFDEDENIEDE